MKLLFICFLTLTVWNFSCTENPSREKKAAIKEAAPVTAESYRIDTSKIGLPIISASSILIDFRHFWDYYARSINLSSDFNALNTSGEDMTKNEFLKQMNSGLYFPLEVHSKNNVASYKLCKIPAKADKNISLYMIQFSKDEQLFYKMEGKKIPHFNFLDINGKQYTSENTIGKIVLLKCWFISCHACVNEMPALNELVAKYRDRKDILFVSLAIDTKKKLQEFLNKTTFNYATVPGQEEYMSKKLNVSAYPTHFLINKEGVLVRVMKDADQTAKALEEETVK